MPSKEIDCYKLASTFTPYPATSCPESVEQTSSAAVQARCSLHDLRKRTAELAGDEELGEALKSRWTRWIGAEGSKKEAEQADDAAEEGDEAAPEVRKRGRPRKRARKTPDVQPLPLEIVEKRDELEARLPKAFRFYEQDALMKAYVERESRVDSNAIAQPTPSHLVFSKPPTIPEAPPKELRDAILRITIFSRPAAGRGKHGLPLAMLDATHEDLSSPPTRTQDIEVRADQTLADFRHAIVCRFDDLPARDGGTHGAATLLDGVSFTGKKRNTDSVFCIDGRLYGEQASSPESYARLIGASSSRARQSERLGIDPSAPKRITESHKRMRDIRFRDLPLRTGQTYWFLHQGSCEHAWEITSIRAPHVTDIRVTSGGAGDPSLLHPRTTFLTTEVLMRPIVRCERVFAPPESYTLTKCSLCARRPARMLVVGGARVGESVAHVPDEDAEEGEGEAAAAAGLSTSNETHVAVVGLPEQQAPVCQSCWGFVAPQPTQDGESPLPTPNELPPVQLPVPGAFADASKERWARAGGPSWTVVPLLD